MACLDTSALLDLAGHSGRRVCKRVQERVRELHTVGEALATTRFSVAELWVGIHRSRDKKRELDRVRTLLDPLVVLDFDQRAAEVFGRIVGHLQDEGTPVGDMDALIAAVCVVYGHPIVTRNAKDFTRIPGLDVESY